MGPPVSLLVEGRSKRPGGAPARRASGAPPSSARGGPGGDTGRHAAPHPEGFDPTLESPPDRHAAVSPASIEGFTPIDALWPRVYAMEWRGHCCLTSRILDECAS